LCSHDPSSIRKEVPKDINLNPKVRFDYAQYLIDVETFLFTGIL